MNAMELMELMGDLPEQMLDDAYAAEEAEPPRQKWHRILRTAAICTGAAAACLVAVLRIPHQVEVPPDVAENVTTTTVTTLSDDTSSPAPTGTTDNYGSVTESLNGSITETTTTVSEIPTGETSTTQDEPEETTTQSVTTTVTESTSMVNSVATTTTDTSENFTGEGNTGAGIGSPLPIVVKTESEIMPPMGGDPGGLDGSIPKFGDCWQDVADPSVWHIQLLSGYSKATVAEGNVEDGTLTLLIYTYSGYCDQRFTFTLRLPEKLVPEVRELKLKQKEVTGWQPYYEKDTIYVQNTS